MVLLLQWVILVGPSLAARRPDGWTLDDDVDGGLPTCETPVSFYGDEVSKLWQFGTTFVALAAITIDRGAVGATPLPRSRCQLISSFGRSKQLDKPEDDCRIDLFLPWHLLLYYIGMPRIRILRNCFVAVLTIRSVVIVDRPRHLLSLVDLVLARSSR